ncbi:hypothetical protein [Dethiobacter alkaliphilus]|uniref:hypothetical protein n=1 Tax=Dethiobacter alkaliphilus TaxID=427926 RepID=UPI0022265F0D|nr:hypothetical protein [Dethiobacter alkaliphilus]MCW3488675.1 hypothetical protein [Dethiobacter alkaliphilus]
MTRAVVDPDELKRFAVYLNGMALSVRKKKGHLNGKFKSLKDVWRDNKYRQFERTFTETMSQLEQFSKSAEQYAQKLRDKEKPLRRYEDSRY